MPKKEKKTYKITTLSVYAQEWDVEAISENDAMEKIKYIYDDEINTYGEEDVELTFSNRRHVEFLKVDPEDDPEDIKDKEEEGEDIIWD